MTVRIPCRAGGTAALALAVWQCGGDLKAGAELSQIDACALVPQAEMEQLVDGAFEKVDRHFEEHTYMKPVNYSAGCIYGGPRTIILWVNYPAKTGGTTSEQLAGRISERLKSSAEDDPSMAELYGKVEVRPVSGLAGAAAEYEMLGQTMLEVHAGPYRVSITAPSLGVARAVAEKVTSRVP